MKNLLLALSLSSMLIPESAMAIELNERLNLNGFFSQGFVKSPENPYAGEDSLDGSFKIREAAVNVLWEPADKLKFTGQVMHRQFLEAADTTELDFLFMDYNLYGNSQSDYGIRLGRIKNQFGLYNAVRDIPNARPGITVPNGYFNSLRDLMLSTDGIEIYGLQKNSLGGFNFSFAVGARDFDSDKLEEYFFSDDLEADYHKTSNLSFNLRHQSSIIPGLVFGASLLGFESKIDNVNTSNQSFSLKNRFSILNRVLYAQYSYGNWMLSGEYLRTTIDSKIDHKFDFFDIESVASVDDYYVQIEYFFNQFSLMTRFEKLDFENKKLNSTYEQTKGYTLGSRWYIDKNFTLSAELSSSNGVLWAPVYPDVDYEKMKDDWKVYQLQLTYQF